MAVKYFNAKFSDIAKSHYLVSTYNFFRLRKVIDEDVLFLQTRLSNYFEIISGYAFSSKDYIDDGVLVCRISDISKSNELLTDEMLKLPEDYNEKFEKYQIKNNDILIGLTGDGKYFKTCFVKNLEIPVLLNQRVGILRIKQNIEDFSPKFAALLFNLDKVQNQIRVVAMGKTQKNVSPFDILNVKIPKISLEKQNRLIDLIEPLETELTHLKNSKENPLMIINKVFRDEFSISLSLLEESESINKIIVKLANVSFNNSQLRNSFRWNKMQVIQKILFENIDCVKTLGKYVKSTKNGWSPNSVEEGTGIPVLGQEHFAFDTILRIDASKYTEHTRNNIESFYIQQGDFFVSRGNTVDLVALASIVEQEVNEDIIFPDLYIKMELDETEVDKQYLAYLFNSFFGRLYFKYVAKGKNQSMVKVSSTELMNFRIPLPNKETQLQIVEKIKSQIEAQNIVDEQIAAKQQEINHLIENAIQDN